MIEEDTIKVADKAATIKQKMLEFDVLINKMYKKLVDMPTNNIWKGPAADKYIQRVLADKVEMLNYSNGIKSIASELERFSNDTDATIKIMEDNI